MAENSDTLLRLAQLGYSMLVPIVLTGYTISQCGGKKNKGAPAGGGGGAKTSEKSGGASQKSEKKEADKPAAAAPDANGPKAPTDKNAVAGTHDPNYQTLAGVDANVFQEKGGAAPAGGAAAPAAGAPKPGGPGMAGIK